MVSDGGGIPPLDTNVVTVEGGRVIEKRPPDTAIEACACKFSVAEVTHGVIVAAVIPFRATPKGTLEPLSLMATTTNALVAGFL
jgi:hypothetical protein